MGLFKGYGLVLGLVHLFLEVGYLHLELSDKVFGDVFVALSNLRSLIEIDAKEKYGAIAIIRSFILKSKLIRAMIY